MTYSWSGLSLEEIKAGRQSVLIFALGLLLVYLTLAGQYESLTLPFIILLSVPLAILGALSAQWGRGLIDDVYCQIGLVMLIGLSAKNGILIVEFAEQLRHRGMTIAEAAVEAARIRLRPILMTIALVIVASGFSRTVHAQPPVAIESVTFQQALDRAFANNPSAVVAAAGILRAEGLLAQARSATLLQITGNVQTTTLNKGVE